MERGRTRPPVVVLVSQQKASVLSEQQTSVLSQKQTSFLSQQKTSGCFGVILEGTKMISTPFLHLRKQSHEHYRHTAVEMPPRPAAQGLRQHAGGKDDVSS